MSVVQYDEDFDKKVAAGAVALLKEKNIVQENIEPDRWKALFDVASSQARTVLLAAMAVTAQAKN